MITSNITDEDGFKLQFEENCSESDRLYFISQYPKIDLVAAKRLHCTTCDVHIGTAPISEKTIRTHQVLGVTQCNKCFAFYNSGEFGKGEDGSEYYCRWCGQGGEVFCCSTCPFVFCNKCIKWNLSSSYVKEIEENDDWSCFVCNKEILKHHRGVHWALRNFMNKQLEKIQKTNVTSEDELNNLLNEDIAVCCPNRKKRKSFAKPTPAPVKRPSGGFASIQQPPAKKAHVAHQPAKPKTSQNLVAKITAAKLLSSSTSNKEIVCTPDIMGLIRNKNVSEEGNVRISSAPIAATPPPLVMRNNQRNQRLPNQTAVTALPPAFHNVNGFQIDLNHASRQEIFRLPNGKLIQVRKQTSAPPPMPGFRPPIMPLRQPQFTFRQAAPGAPRMRTMFSNVRARGSQNQRCTFEAARAAANAQQIAAAQLQQQKQIPASQAQIQAPMSTIFTQQNGSISVARAQQPNTPFGAAKTEFEDKIINGMEICQHTINKMITLTNSTSFKSSHNFSDLKELYIHLQYLFTYTAGKFKLLQESLTTGMESLAKFEDPKDKIDADELTIVEEKADIIEVLSDDEEPPLLKPKEEKITEKVPETVAVKRPIIKHIQYVPKDTLEAATTVSSETAIAVASITPAAPVPIECIENFNEIDEALEESNETMDVLIAGDRKLKNKVVVKVEKMENSKNPIIKLFYKKLQERVESESRASSSSRSTTPDVDSEMLLNVSVEIDEESVAKEKELEADPKLNKVTLVDVDDSTSDHLSQASTVLNDESAIDETENPNSTENKPDEADDLPKPNESDKEFENIVQIDALPPDELMESETVEHNEVNIEKPDSETAVEKSTETLERPDASEKKDEVPEINGTEAEKISEPNNSNDCNLNDIWLPFVSVDNLTFGAADDVQIPSDIDAENFVPQDTDNIKVSDNDIDALDSLLISRIEAEERENGSL